MFTQIFRDFQLYKISNKCVHYYHFIRIVVLLSFGIMNYQFLIIQVFSIATKNRMFIQLLIGKM